MTKNFKIVCPVDFSECSLNAVEYAARLGEKYRADLILIHVPDKEDYQKLAAADGHGGDQYAFIKKKLDSLVLAVEKESLAKGLASCQPSIKEGKIVSMVVDFANDSKADLIVMGTEGVNEFKNNYIGTKASKIVAKSNIDVFVIPRKVYFKPPRKFVYATDYMEEDKVGVQKIVEMAGFFDSEIDVVHVSSKDTSIDKSLHKTMVEELSPFVKYEKVNYVLKSYRDEPGLGLENYLITAKGDVLVTLSKKKTWFEQVFTNNLSKKMSYFINKPLLVLKRA